VHSYIHRYLDYIHNCIGGAEVCSPRDAKGRNHVHVHVACKRRRSDFPNMFMFMFMSIPVTVGCLWKGVAPRRGVSVSRAADALPCLSFPASRRRELLRVPPSVL
jgi:hypothetical protein